MNTSRDGDSTPSLGSAGPCLTSLSFFLSIHADDPFYTNRFEIIYIYTCQLLILSYNFLLKCIPFFPVLDFPEIKFGSERSAEKEICDKLPRSSFSGQSWDLLYMGMSLWS